MNILHFYKTALPQTMGGVQVFIDTLCRNTAPLGIHNTVLALTDNSKKTPTALTPYPVIYCKTNLELASTGFSLSAFSKFRALAAQADIIHYHFPNPFADMLHFLCRIKKPTLITYHSDIVKQKTLLKLYQPLMKRFLQAADALVATSPNYLDSSLVLAQFKTKTHIIPIGLNQAAYPPLNLERLAYWKARLPKTFFLFIGALRYYKGLHIALEALRGTDMTLVIAGTGNMEAALKQQAQTHALQQVHFLGHISEDDKAVLLHLSYAFVFPSHVRSEAFGIALLEAAMYRKPLISCDIGTGTSYINRHQETGWIVPPDSPEALRSAMRYFINNPKQTEKFGKCAYQRYQQYFTADRQAYAYHHLYKKIME